MPQPPSTRPPLSQLSLQYWGKVHLERWNPIATRSLWRIFFNHGTGMTIQGKETTYDPGKDGPILIAPGTSISTSLHQPVEHFFIHFQAIDHLLKPKAGIYALPKSFFSKQDKEAFSRHPSLPGNWPLQSLAARCMTALPQNQWENPCPDPFIQSILQYIERNLHLPLDNLYLAQKLNMTLHTFVRRFTRATKTSPQKAIETRRLEQACKALEHSEMSIESIAEECGYQNRFYFSNRFKKKMKVSPGKYRKQALGLLSS